MDQLEILRESLGQCDEIILDALIMRNRIVEDIMAHKEANGLQILQPEQEAKQKNGWKAEWKADAIKMRWPMYLTASAPTVNASRQESFLTIILY